MGLLNAANVVAIQVRNLVLVAGLVADAANFRVAAGVAGAGFQIPIMTRIVAGGALGELTATLTPGNPGTFQINSSNAGDTSTVRAILVDVVT